MWTFLVPFPHHLPPGSDEFHHACLKSFYFQFANLILVLQNFGNPAKSGARCRFNEHIFSFFFPVFRKMLKRKRPWSHSQGTCSQVHPGSWVWSSSQVSPSLRDKLLGEENLHCILFLPVLESPTPFLSLDFTGNVFGENYLFPLVHVFLQPCAAQQMFMDSSI